MNLSQLNQKESALITTLLNKSLCVGEGIDTELKRFVCYEDGLPCDIKINGNRLNCRYFREHVIPTFLFAYRVEERRTV